MDRELYLKMGRPHNTCVVCGANINEEGKHPSTLMQPGAPRAADKGDEELRRDYCATCWEKQIDPNYLGFWLTKRERPKPKKIQNRKERNAALVSLFDTLHGQNNTDNAQHLFFLAHLLMKYGVFKWVRSDPPAADGEGERIVFRNSVTDDHVVVESVLLEDERLAQIKSQVDEYLANYVAPDAEGAAAAGPVAAEGADAGAADASGEASAASAASAASGGAGAANGVTPGDGA